MVLLCCRQANPVSQHLHLGTVPPAVVGTGVTPPIPASEGVGGPWDDLREGQYNVVGLCPGQVAALLDECGAHLDCGLGAAV